MLALGKHMRAWAAIAAVASLAILPPGSRADASRGGSAATGPANAGGGRPPEGAIEAAMAHYALAVRTLPPDSVAACFAPEGELLLPGLAPVDGPEAIRDFLAPMAAGSVVDTTTMQSELIAGDAALASQWGTYRQVAGPKGGAHGLYVGRFSALWEFDPRARRWLLARLMMQPMPTPVAPAPASGSPPGK